MCQHVTRARLRRNRRRARKIYTHAIQLNDDFQINLMLAMIKKYKIKRGKIVMMGGGNDD